MGVNEVSGIKRGILVVKIGTSILTNSEGRLSRERLRFLVGEISQVLDGGVRVVVVSSGAVGAGVGVLGWHGYPKEIVEKQVAASVGQPFLMEMYSRLFAEKGRKVAQILLTPDVFWMRSKYLNARNTLLTLLKEGLVPIVNENDTVAVDEIKFGDNDTLAAYVSLMVDADCLVLLTDVKGFLLDGKVVREIDNVQDGAILGEARGSSGKYTTGGMITKLRAAQIATSGGVETYIASGYTEGVLKEIVSGGNPGTRFRVPASAKSKARKKWLFTMASSRKDLPRVEIDKGACRALMSGKSLLPVGVKSIEGKFDRGDIVEVTYGRKAIGWGLANYSSGELARIMGRRSEDIEKILGYRYSDEFIHRDNFVLSPTEIVRS